MSPIPTIAKPEAVTPKAPEPSTWKVITTIAGSLYFTYVVYSTSTRVWKWIQSKLEKPVEQPQKLQKRNTVHGLEKRWLPFEGSVNFLYWMQRVVQWIYFQADMLPVRIQNGVDREYRKTQDSLWDQKNEEANDKVKTILAKEFPEYYDKRYPEQKREINVIDE